MMQRILAQAGGDAGLEWGYQALLPVDVVEGCVGWAWGWCGWREAMVLPPHRTKSSNKSDAWPRAHFLLPLTSWGALVLGLCWEFWGVSGGLKATRHLLGYYLFAMVAWMEEKWWCGWCGRHPKVGTARGVRREQRKKQKGKPNGGEEGLSGCRWHMWCLGFLVAYIYCPSSPPFVYCIQIPILHLPSPFLRT